MPKLDQAYVQRMEEVLDLLNQPVDQRAPVVTLDERSVQLRASQRPGIPLAPGRFVRQDYEYVRHGTANLFCIVEPKNGRHHTHVTDNRTAPQFAKALRRIAQWHRAARTIHLVMDHLNTHRAKSLTDTFGQREGRRLWARFTVHYTPKPGSWLNPAELEASLWSRQCLGRERIATLAELSARTRVWNTLANRFRRAIDWRFTTADARRVFGYKRSAMLGSKH